jgi:hypothetical protein
LLLVVGVASLVYGAKYHIQQVYEEQEIEISLELPGMEMPGMEGMPPGMPGMDDPLLGGQPPIDPMMPFAPIPPEKQTIKQQVLVCKEEPEGILTRDVTIGGLVLFEGTALKRTYSGEPPSLCPT